MTFSLTEAIRSITDLKRNARDILDQIHRTGRPIVLTVNGKADAVLVDVKTYEEQLMASNLGKLLAQAEEDIAGKKTRPIGQFLKEFKNAHKV